ncbi:MAG: hypothetical protein P8P33_04575 [Flavobacteriaceae bacterium]|nr:hypothetical protein [Flavobacteriaceae bacterium]
MKNTFLVLICLLLANCSTKLKPDSIEVIAEEYVRLVLQVGQYDSAVVDAYFGPEEWKPNEQKAAIFPEETLVNSANDLLSKCKTLLDSKSPNLNIRRVEMLQKQLIALRTKVQMIGGKTYSFDEEAALLYDAEPPFYPLSYFDKLLDEMDQLLNGDAVLSSQYTKFMEQFIIPKNMLDRVFSVATDESRAITKQYLDLPTQENFVLEYVNDKVWSGYNYYQGDSQSLIQINTDFPIHIDRAIDLASHEGYPGHHIYMMLLDQNLVNTKGWMEYSVYPLFSPLSFISEGSANYGIDMVFPGEKRLAFERDVLFPIIGISKMKAEKFHKVQELKAKLKYAENEIARRYLNGIIEREEAVGMIETYLLFSPKKAIQRLNFIETNRSYVINYNLGRDQVAKHMKLSGADPELPEKRWQIFKELLSNPYSSSTLKK